MTHHLSTRYFFPLNFFTLSLRWAVGLLCALAACQVARVSPAHAHSLSDRIEPLIAKHQGTVCVAIKHFATGETFFHRPQDVLYVLQFWFL